MFRRTELKVGGQICGQLLMHNPSNVLFMKTVPATPSRKILVLEVDQNLLRVYEKIQFRTLIIVCSFCKEICIVKVLFTIIARIPFLQSYP